MAPKKPEEPAGKHVGIWIRVSTEEQAQGDSPKHHEERARRYAEANGWKVVEIYHLEAVSGKSVMGHAEAQRMMRDVERGHITGLIFSRIARFCRNTKELLEIADFFQAHGAALVCVEQSIDLATPASRLMFTLNAAIASWEREEIAARVSASVAIRAKLGKPLGGRPPLGYMWSPEKTLVVDPKTAPIRKQVHELFLEHRRKLRVATILNEAGHRTQFGHKFTVTTIERLLRDPVAKGIRRMNYITNGDGKKGRGIKPESEWVFIEVEAIVPAETWDRCVQILDEQKASKYKRPARKPVQLLGGLTWCECGHKMYVRANTPKYVCEKCRNKIPTELLEGIFFERLTRFSLSASEVAAHLKTANANLAHQEELLALARKNQAKAKADMDRLMDLYLAGELPKEGFGNRYAPLQERHDQLEAEISRLQGEMDYIKARMLSQDEILTQAQNLYDRWPKMTLEKKRKVVEAIVKKVTIGRENIHFDLYFLPSDEDPDDSSDPEDDPQPPRTRKSPPHITSANSKNYASLQDMAKSSRYARQQRPTTLDIRWPSLGTWLSSGRFMMLPLA